ncbi:MAG TPA: glycosyltransferase family 4 protein [Verrucomicrobiae bacterium]|nr:glycosyltransferase family 4 protein [Verrucomicrobiae bacterium]
MHSLVNSDGEDRAQRALTFVLPGDGRSGGVRVTVIMANLLLQRGYSVRIACPNKRETMRSKIGRLAAFWQGQATTAGFLHEFTGTVAFYDTLDELDFREDEIVIAVGTYSVPDVRALAKPVTKLRFNHGFPAKPNPLQDQAWRGSMPTITVSNTLVARLEEMSGEPVIAVVPNGIDTQQYFPEAGVSRTGIGAVFNSHPNKAPEDMLALLEMVRQRWPEIPQIVFSTERQPRRLRHVNYTRLPSVAAARNIYNRCRIWLLTSRTEGLPGVVLEAMACGCIVISTDNDGSLEILRHNENGLVVQRGDLPAFLEQIDSVLKNDSLAQRLAAGALETAQSFTWSRAADKMESALARVPSGQGRIANLSQS